MKKMKKMFILFCHLKVEPVFGDELLHEGKLAVGHIRKPLGRRLGHLPQFLHQLARLLGRRRRRRRRRLALHVLMIREEEKENGKKKRKKNKRKKKIKIKGFEKRVTGNVL